MNQIEFDALIKSKAFEWTPLTDLILPNEDSGTRNNSEFIRLTTLFGDGFIDESVGVRTVDGSSVGHAFVLRFDVFTKINTGTDRASEICQDILNYWQVKELSVGCTTTAGSIINIGEEPPHYRLAVTIAGEREEFINP